MSLERRVGSVTGEEEQAVVVRRREGLRDAVDMHFKKTSKGRPTVEADEALLKAAAGLARLALQLDSFFIFFSRPPAPNKKTQMIWQGPNGHTTAWKSNLRRLRRPRTPLNSYPSLNPSGRNSTNTMIVESGSSKYPET
jgi:hypothetical protein